VLFVVQNGGEMCVTDPPGYAGNGFCQGATGGFDAGPIAGRFKAILALQAADAGAAVSAAMEPWNVIPYGVPPQGFEPFSQIDAGEIAALQDRLASVDDMQGALERAALVVEADILATDAGARAGSRYVAILLGDGVPNPRCAANDALATYADAGDPALIWADSTPYCNTGSNGFCNPATGIDDAGQRCIPGFPDGGDRNQNYQLFSAVDRILGFKSQYGVGDVQVYSRLVFSSPAVAGCGLICNDLFGGMSAGDARSVGGWTLQQIALHGNGTFVDPVDPQKLTLGDIPLSPLVCQ
jgi:hypothetical protein